MVNALSALFGVLAHAGTRRYASFNFNDDSALAGVDDSTHRNNCDIACCVSAGRAAV